MPDERDWMTGQRIRPCAAPGTPAPSDMPLRLIVLESLADGAETLVTMRNYGAGEPSGLALVGEDHITAELRSLMSDGLVEAVPDASVRHLYAGEHLPHTDNALRHFWFSLTRLGRLALDEGDAALEAYWDTR